MSKAVEGEKFSDPFQGQVPLLQFTEGTNARPSKTYFYGSTTEPLKTNELVMMTRGMNYLMESFKYKIQNVSYYFQLPHSWTVYELRRPQLPVFRLAFPIKTNDD